MQDEKELGFSYWYEAYTDVYQSAPRTYLEKEFAYLRKALDKMGRGYSVRLVAQNFAARDVHYQYYGGRVRDEEKDNTVARGPMHTGNGRKNPGQGFGYSRESSQLAAG